MSKHEEARLNIDEQTNSSRKALHQYVDECEATEKELEELKRDVKRYMKLEKSMGMMNTWLGTLDEMKEFSTLKNKLSKVGETK